MVTTQKSKIKDFFDDFWAVTVMVLLSPFFLILWIVSLIKGESGEEDWR